MISLRTHAISLAAVFLALAIGVALGSGLLSNTVLSGLRDDKQDLQNQINGLVDEKNALNEKLSAAGEFDGQMSPRILRDSLAGKSVVVFRTPDAADDDVESLSRMVEQAGGTVSGTVALTDEFVNANSAEKLLSVVNSPIVPAGSQLSTKSVDQGSQAGDLLGIALLINRDPKVPAVDDQQRDTVLTALRDTGFITYGADRIGSGQHGADRHRRWSRRRCREQGRHRRPLRCRAGPARLGHRRRRPRRHRVRHRRGRRHPVRSRAGVLGQHGRRHRRRFRADHHGAGATGPDQRRTARPVRRRAGRNVGNNPAIGRVGASATGCRGRC